MNTIIHTSPEEDSRGYTRRRPKPKRTNIMLAFVFLIVFPIYPASGSYLYHRTGGIEVYEVDESTILASYDASEYFEKVSLDQSGFIETNVALEDRRDWKNTEDVLIYTVKPGDTLGELSQSFDISVDTIKWANDLSSGPLRVGKELTILPIDGVVHVVKKGEGIHTIAKEYQIPDKINEILQVNKMEGIQDLQVDQKIILPGARPIPKPVPQPTVQPESSPTIRPQSSPIRVVRNTTGSQTSGDYNFAGPTEYIDNPDESGYYPLTLQVSSGCRKFSFGNCTCFVAKYKNVSWRGNAKDWLKNAEAQGVPTGGTPRAGAIVVYAGRGTHPVYGHVGIVRKVENDTIVVTDMNYRRFNEVTTRRENISHGAIIGYIYVD